MRNNSGHLLVQNEVQVKSAVAGWTPFLPASPVPGAEEHESGQGEPLEASAQGFGLRGGHDLQPGERVGSSPSHAPRTRQDPQGRAIRGDPPLGPLTPPRSPETPRKQLSGGVQGFPSGFRFDSVSRFQVSRIPILYSAAFFLRGCSDAGPPPGAPEAALGFCNGSSSVSRRFFVPGF